MKPKLTPEGIAWFKTRGISQATLDKMPVGIGTVFQGKPAVYFQYRDGWKARTFPDKKFTAGGGFKATFWNLDAVLMAKPGTVYITEGEIDALAIIEAGIPEYQVLSVPNGARDRPSEDPFSQKGYAYALDALREGLGQVQRFVWCGDADEPGLILRDDMLKVIGAARFMYVTWPDGVKDANEMLLKEGAEAAHELLVHGAILWPQAGLYRLSELPAVPPLVIWEPPLPGFEGRVRLAPRTLSVVTGQPGAGKTQLFSEIWFRTIKSYNLVACIASFETGPVPHLRRQLRTLLTGHLETDLSEAERSQADAWINERYLFLLHPEQRPTLEWFLECAETAVVRHGAKIIQLDPWNRLEATRSYRENETEYIARCLRSLYVFAQDMDCHVQIIAHPAKMDGPRRGQPPTLEDISGSKHFENMVDQGFVVHRPQMFEGTDRKTETAFYHRKARFEDLGFPCKIMLRYDLSQRCYVGMNDEAQELE